MCRSRRRYGGYINKSKVDVFRNTNPYFIGGLIKSAAGIGDKAGESIGGETGATISGIFNPSKNLSVWGKSDVSAGEKLLGTILPGLGASLANRSDAKAAKQAKERAENLEKVSNLPVGTGGIVPGVANPYMLALGGVANIVNNSNEAFTEYNAGGTHEQNIHGGVPIGMGENGKMNTVQEGETSYKFKMPNGEVKRYVFSHDIIV